MLSLRYSLSEFKLKLGFLMIRRWILWNLHEHDDGTIKSFIVSFSVKTYIFLRKKYADFIFIVGRQDFRKNVNVAKTGSNNIFCKAFYQLRKEKTQNCQTVMTTDDIRDSNISPKLLLCRPLKNMESIKSKFW